MSYACTWNLLKTPKIELYIADALTSFAVFFFIIPNFMQLIIMNEMPSHCLSKTKKTKMIIFSSSYK